METEEQLRNMAAKAYNALGENQTNIQWMDGYVAGYVAHQQLLNKHDVSGRSEQLCSHKYKAIYLGMGYIRQCTICGDVQQ